MLQHMILNCRTKKEMVPTTEDTKIVISPSPIPKEEDTDLSKELIPEKEVLSKTDISISPIDENDSSSDPNSNRISLISQASTISRASIISEKCVLLLIF